MNLKDILDKPKHSIYLNKYEHPNVTLAMAFIKPMGELNPFVRFGYGLNITLYHNKGKSSEPINADTITAKKQVNNNQ